MSNLLYWLFLMVLLVIGCRGLLQEIRDHKKRQMIEMIFDPLQYQNLKKNKQDKQTALMAFEKMVTQNDRFSDFLHRFQNNHLWKIYSIITLFSLFFIINEIFTFFVLTQSELIIVLVIFMIIIVIVPSKVSENIVETRIRKVSRDVPYLIDILAIIIQSGYTIEAALIFVKDKITPVNPDLSLILERACVKMEISGISSAISLIYDEVPSREMRMFCSTLQQSVNYGSSIYNALLELSSEIREIQILEVEEKITAASAKMTVPMMAFIFFPILVIVIAPVIIRLLRLFSNAI